MRSANQWWKTAVWIAEFFFVVHCGCSEDRPLVSFGGDTSSDTSSDTNDTDLANDCSSAEVITTGQYFGSLDGENTIELDANASCWGVTNCPTTGPEQAWAVTLGPWESVSLVADNFDFSSPDCSIAGYLVSSCAHDEQASCATPDITCLGEGACIRAVWNTGELMLNKGGSAAGGTFWFIFDTQEGCAVDYEFDLSITF